MEYAFESERLGFRNWMPTDIEKMCAINADKKVMEFFPGVLSKEQTFAFIERMQKQYAEKGFCYFAVDKLANHEFIGFIGLSEQTYEAQFTPCIDIGWRISSQEWNKGFATEGAKRCLAYGFNDLNIKKIVSVAPKVNDRSEDIMTKIGMKKQYEFDHPMLANNDILKKCVLYEIEK
jgi:RimJ/RimL family protein N-acetyltransferase